MGAVSADKGIVENKKKMESKKGGKEKMLFFFSFFGLLSSEAICYCCPPHPSPLIPVRRMSDPGLLHMCRAASKFAYTPVYKCACVIDALFLSGK